MLRLVIPASRIHPFLNATWCLCGAVIHKGRPTTVDQHITCCGGQLDRFKEGD